MAPPMVQGGNLTASELWQQILLAPGDKSLKDQYMQALARSGDPRAEIFRLAEELKKHPSYYAQHDGLLKQYEQSLASWRAELDAPARQWQAELIFIEGWPIEITIAAQDFVRHAAQIVATVPLRHLNPTAIDACPKMFEVSQLSQIGSIQGSTQLWTGGPIRALANCRHLSSLRWLNLSHCQLTDDDDDDDDVEVWAASPNLRKVEHLDLSNNPCRDPVDAACGYGTDGNSGFVVPESIQLPEFGKELKARFGKISWLNALSNFMEKHPPKRYLSTHALPKSFMN